MNMTSGILFGPAGVPHSSPSRSSEGGIIQVRRLGLGCMELEFVRRVGMGTKTAKAIFKRAQMEEVKLSVHAPYYINLNSKEPEKLKASKQRILQSAKIGALCGAESVVIHAAFYHDDTPELVYEKVKKAFKELINSLRKENIWICLRPETMGKPSQFGSLEEVIKLSKEVEGVMPCVDFAHLHARSKGKCNSYEEFSDILRLIRKELGESALEEMHIHLSGIEYGPKGELRHLNLAESDFNYIELLRALKDFGVEGCVICESPNLEEDALLLQEHYLALSNPISMHVKPWGSSSYGHSRSLPP
jgi:deoxyribonuclease-4